MTTNKRIVFMGTPDFAAHSLSVLADAGIDIAAVVTVPDKPAGRGQKLHSSDVKLEAQRRGFDILQPISLKDSDFLNTLESYHADLFVVVAFRMLPEAVWGMPPKGTINLHASLLPQYRGAAPIQWAVINGETQTGVTTFFIEKDIDTGQIIGSRKVEITNQDNAGTLHDKLMLEGGELLLNTVLNIFEDNVVATPQSELLSKELILKPAPKIFKKDCQVDWNKDAISIYNFIRGLSPYPTAWTILETIKQSITVKIFNVEILPFKSPIEIGTVDSDNCTYLRIAAKDAWISFKEIQPEGKKRMSIADFLRGNHIKKISLVSSYFEK